MRTRVRRVRAARVRVFALAAAASFAALSFASMPGTAVHATPSGPAVTAQPNSSISDGQYLRVSFTGFTPGEPFDFRQCIASPVTISTDCTPIVEINHSAVTAIADRKGAGATYVPVYSGTDQLLANDGGTGSIICDVTHPCTVALMPDPNSLTTSVLVPITFAPSQDLCPPPGAGAVVGSGSATAYRAMYSWEAAVCQPPSSLAVQYSLKNSPDGVLSFLSGSTQFGITGPWSPTYLPTSNTSPPQTWDYAPITMSGLVLAYRMYDRRGPQITTLTLTPDLIAKVFNGSLNDLATDSTVAALNPRVQFPSLLNTFVRAEHSAESWVFTSWLAANAPTVWTYGTDEIFPAPAGVIAATGSAAVGFDVVSNPNQTFAGQGTIGFMDSSTAAYYGLPTVNIANADGTVTPATTSTIAKAVSEATLNSDRTVTPATGDETAWPMLIPTYMMAPTNLVTPANGTTIANMLRYGVQAGQANLPLGYVPLRSDMVTASLAAAAAIPVTAPPPTPIPLPPTPTFSSNSNFGSFTAPKVVPSASPSPAAAPAIPGTGTVTAVATSAPLLLSGDDSHLFLPAAMGFAALCVFGGVLTEVYGRARRRVKRRALRVGVRP
jgi:ABC-type phosphate transport system substrate-binding protein